MAMGQTRDMETPVASLLSPGWMQGQKQLPWTWAVERLEAERNYWLVTVRRDGFPQARPVWGVWSDDGLFLSVGHGGLQRAAGNPPTPITVHVDSARDVVIIEGTVDRVAPYETPDVKVEPSFEVDRAILRSSVERYNKKYNWNFDLDGGGLNFLVRPRIVYGWRTDVEVEGSTKWTWP